jgi:hypothetical protein
MVQTEEVSARDFAMTAVEARGIAAVALRLPPSYKLRRDKLAGQEA